jgi:hypothetical protein
LHLQNRILKHRIQYRSLSLIPKLLFLESPHLTRCLLFLLREYLMKFLHLCRYLYRRFRLPYLYHRFR